MALRNTLRPFLTALEPSFRQATTPSSLVPAGSSLFGGPAGALWQQPASLFNELFHNGPVGAFPAVSVEEKQGGYEITADVPGLKKDEIRVRLADANHRLILEGETKSWEKAEEPASAADATATIKDDAAGSTAASDGGGDAQAPLGETSSTQAVTHRQSDSPALLINERSTYSAFRRAFAFHEPLDPASIKARLEHGQLRVSVQKKDQPEGEGVVEIQVE